MKTKTKGELLKTVGEFDDYIIGHPSVWSEQLKRTEPVAFVVSQPYRLLTRLIKKQVYYTVKTIEDEQITPS